MSRVSKDLRLTTLNASKIMVGTKIIASADPTIGLGGVINLIDNVGGNLYFNNVKLTGVEDPTNPQDVTTKAYVDNAISAAVSGGTWQTLDVDGSTNVPTNKNIVFLNILSTSTGTMPAAPIGTTIKLIVSQLAGGSSYTLTFTSPQLISAGGISTSITFTSIGQGVTLVYGDADVWIIQDGGVLVS